MWGSCVFVSLFFGFKYFKMSFNAARVFEALSSIHWHTYHAQAIGIFSSSFLGVFWESQTGILTAVNHDRSFIMFVLEFSQRWFSQRVMLLWPRSSVQIPETKDATTSLELGLVMILTWSWQRLCLHVVFFVWKHRDIIYIGCVCPWLGNWFTALQLTVWQVFVKWVEASNYSYAGHLFL